MKVLLWKRAWSAVVAAASLALGPEAHAAPRHRPLPPTNVDINHTAGNIASSAGGTRTSRSNCSAARTTRHLWTTTRCADGVSTSSRR